jgi:hypothetical protein
MANTKLTLFVKLFMMACLFIGLNNVYGAGGVPNPWGLTPTTRGTEWTGILVISGQIADVPGLPAGLPDNYFPLNVPGYKDQVVKIKFFVRLGNKKYSGTSYSGMGRDVNNNYLFYALGDYGSGRLGEALNKFLADKVYPNLPGGPYNGALTELTEESNNVESQLVTDPYGRNLFKAESPLFYSANIKVVTY